jgi:response regulator of citrate/malate metabolism
LKLKPQQIDALKTMYESKKHTVEEVCAVFGVSKPTLYRYLEIKVQLAQLAGEIHLKNQRLF